MLLTHWLKQLDLARLLPTRHRRQQNRRLRASSAQVCRIEELEDRTLLATFTITNLNDDAIDGTVDTLREAVIAANNEVANPGADTIILGPGTYTLSLGGFFEDAAARGDLDITSQILIQGAGAGQTTIDAAGIDRVLHVLGTGNLTVTGLTLSGGTVTTNTGGGMKIEAGGTTSVTNATLSGNFAVSGGGIFNNGGTVSVTNSTLSGNSTSNDGGGIFNDGGTASVTNSTLSGNSASFGGGILINGGTASITNSILSGNSANDDGGGIFNNGTVSVTNSTLSGNSATEGGGIFNFAGAANITANVTNSTLSGNSATVGGAIFNQETLSITNSTLTGNSASEVGGIFNFGGTASVVNSIITGNTAPTDADVRGTFTSNFHNVVGVIGSSTGFDMAMGDDLGTPANQVINLTLANNGGPTLTHDLILDSPAIDAGLNSAAVDAMGNPLTTDQRGTGFDRIRLNAVDIGAVELQIAASVSIAADQTGLTEGDMGLTEFTFTVTRSQNTNGVTTLDYAIAANGVNAADFGGTLPSGTVTFNEGDTEKTITIQVAGDRTVEADELFTVMLSNPSADSVIATGSASSTIQNDDTATITLEGVNASQVEGTGGTTTAFTFSVTLNNAVQGGFNIAYDTNDGTATVADSDYVDNDGTLNFVGTAGEVQMITVLVNHDSKVEANETFTVALGLISGLGVGVDITDLTVAGSPQTVTIQNDDTATVTLAGVMPARWKAPAERPRRLRSR